MRRWLLLLLPLLLLLGIYGALRQRERWRAAQEDAIYEAVIRHQIQVLDTKLSPRPARYYLETQDAKLYAGPKFMVHFADLGARAHGVAVLDRLLGDLPSSQTEAGKRECCRHWTKLQHDPKQAGVLLALKYEYPGDDFGFHNVAHLRGTWGRKQRFEDWRDYTVQRQHGRWVVTRDRESP
jgi:hypothetical protein